MTFSVRRLRGAAYTSRPARQVRLSRILSRREATLLMVDLDVRCKMQDNLEFLQWFKKYWDTHSRGEEYDAVGRA